MAKYFRWFGLKGELVLTLILSSLAVLFAVLYHTPDRFVRMAAMLLCTGGDLIIMNFKGVRRYLKHLLPAGATLFAFGHICYMLSYGMLFLKNGYSLITNGKVNGGLVTGLLFIGTGMILGCIACVKWGRKRMIPLVLVYGTVLGANCCMILSYAWAAAYTGVLAITAGLGVVVFVISDFGVVMERLDRRHNWHTFVWWLYPIGQLLMVISG